MWVYAWAVGVSVALVAMVVWVYAVPVASALIDLVFDPVETKHECPHCRCTEE